ncbi:hypothetical protein SPRG_10358 [Saprolegnia parasitica CBS 223.65]|uniref:Uncharacterized protein n=1 Tax=Saprolegnia parasitica (strain CBS 223.65) TaxID=695850 RepID=A0A067C1Y4_SAPPC|nr:hypothetical protein SPRG_10358 [Saprolegnia parasitica CBS 223.65]KDO24543.1 hypothetical protein SPRG_10358 [Saprolegnia parasitica CBS 223.65]|eukprot:XP_012204804.1 hypothetical protein SPRG_10358 [Saprolegnia parasitica CBS 223.65]
MSSTHQKHQRYIIRRFPPFVDDDMILRHECLRLLIVFTWALLIFAATVLGALTCDYFLQEPLFYFTVLMVLFVVARAIYRYTHEWPEGLRMRWSYWHEIELSMATYRLKILGYYHRKIDRHLGRFPRGATTEAQMRQYYLLRGVVLSLLFATAYGTFAILLAICDEDAYTQVLLLYVLAVASVCVLYRLAKLHLIELPQVLVLYQRPEFAADMLFTDDERTPFAQPVATYETTTRV